MGHVWRAYDQVLQRDVAVKEVRLPAGLSDADLIDLRERTLREARTAARLSHPNVVRVYDALYDDERPWIVMEYIASRSLATIVRDQGALAPELVARIGLALLHALTAAHHAGVLHRDVKPGNVLLADDGRIMLTDFGLATFDEHGLALTQSGIVYGSPQFIAPERAHDGTSSVAADMWSLGATLYAAVEGRSPYARSSSYATLAALATTTPDPPLHAGALTPVLGGLLIRNPRNRMSADEVRRRLERIIAADSGGNRHIFLPSRHAHDPGDRDATPRSPAPTGATQAGSAASAPYQPRHSDLTHTELITRGGMTRATRAGMAADGTPLPIAAATMTGRPATEPPTARPEIPSPRTESPEPGLRTEVAGIVEAATARITEPPSMTPSTETRGPIQLPARTAASAEQLAADMRASEAAASTSEVEDGESFITLEDSPAPWATHIPARPSRPTTSRKNGGRKSEREWRDNRRPHRWAAPATFIAIVAMVLAIVAVVQYDLFGKHQNPSTTVGAPGPSSGPGGPDGPPPSGLGNPPPGGPPGQQPPPATNLPWFCRPTLPPVPTTMRGSAPLPNEDSLPKGWIWYASGLGFRIAVPGKWQLAAGPTTDCAYDPYNGRILGVDKWSTTAKTPLAALTGREHELIAAGSLPSYQPLRLETVNCSRSCAEWEYAYQGPISILHVRVRAIEYPDGQIYTISWSTWQPDFAANGSNYTRIVDSFVS
jgi:eukaryotic-like serine/threonine-protein kinase